MRKHQDSNTNAAEQIQAKRTMARGVLVLDECLFALLGSALQDANIKVVSSRGWSEQDELLLPHRIMVTNNPAAFVDDAPVYEYGVVAFDKLARVDSAPAYRTNSTAQLLSKAINMYGLWAKGARFLLELRGDGNHVLKELT
jgi:hypothetical protein